jgi:hypothetical protein
LVRFLVWVLRSAWVPAFGLRSARMDHTFASEENATAKQGYERRSPIAYNLPLGACTLIHAFETCPTRTQPTPLKRGCSIIPQHRVSRRWSTPQRRPPRSSSRVLSVLYATKATTKIIYRHCVGSIAASRSALISIACTLTWCCGNWYLSSKPARNASINRRCPDFT